MYGFGNDFPSSLLSVLGRMVNMLNSKCIAHRTLNDSFSASLRRWVLPCSLALFALACDGGSESEQDPTVAKERVEKAEQISEAEDALLGKRDALFTMRRELEEKRQSLVDKRTKVQETGGDTSEIDDAVRLLRKQEKVLESRESEFSRMLQLLIRDRREAVAVVEGNGIAGREAGLAGREKSLARREKELASREAALAKREVGLASKWKEDCGGGISTQTIIRTVDVPGTNYSKKDVEPLLSRARREMSKKGLLASDLPEQARGLESEANAAMKKGDYGRARLASSQLVKTVKALRIDRGFIAGKIQRLNRRMKGKSLSKQTGALFQEATAKYGDGKFSAANRRLNQIYSSLR